MRKVLSVLIAAMVLFSYPLTAGAYIESGQTDSLRCGINLTRLGEMKAEVARECGKPSSSSVGPQYGHDGTFPGVIEEWIYNRGPGDYIYTLKFQEGQLIGIRRGERGF
jgi:hypothetical protein